MKPSKNRVFCKDCGRSKMLFETEKKANTFIKFNSEEIEQWSGYKPERAYFCTYCGGWHVTSQKENLNVKSRTERILDLYNEENEKKAIAKTEKALIIAEKQEQLREIISFLENELLNLKNLEINSSNFRETFQRVLIEFEKTKSYKDINFKGSIKRLRRLSIEIDTLKGKIERNN